ncbi:MAG: Bifunctional protein GlmU [candidate division TM6 bacterium GW2011_GWF2_30_66]|nr:MAG: Bifunctional protein GlmU [candidate division TM6 bacterium GW2011_GWF2_30_66]
MPLYDNLQSVILAAGKSTRFNSSGTKLIEKICGRPMIVYTLRLLEELNINATFVVGHQKELIENTISSNISRNTNIEVNFIHQKEQLGTGHAVACTQDKWKKDNILIINGDTPLVNNQIIEKLYKEHIESNAAISFVVAKCPDSNHAYGRIIREKSGIKIVEAKDFDKNIYTENYDINAGIYIAKTDFLNNCINKINTQNASKEFYLTDLVQIASEKNLAVITYEAQFNRVMGVNTPYELWQTEETKRLDIIKNFIDKGVKFSLMNAIEIDADTQIGAGTLIEYGVQISSGSIIGENCVIKKFSTISNSIIENNVEIYQNSIINNSQICKNTKIGPFAHVHEQSKIEQNSVVGNFVEIKTSTIGQNNLVLHLAYLGNTITGSTVNIGAGTITCNYDGISKHSTTIKNNAFIGSNNTLVAPVTIGESSFTAAGSTITEDVPAHSLAIGRSKQVNKEDYVQRLLEKLRLKSTSTSSSDKKNNINNLEQENYIFSNTCKTNNSQENI